MELPIVLDGTQSDPLDQTSSLADIEGSGYRLRRIVGKLWVFIGQTDAVGASLIGVSAGFIIRRVDPATGISLAASTAETQVNPSEIRNTADPWIWRRDYLLGNGPSRATDTNPLDIGSYVEGIGKNPTTNFGRNYGSAFEGPHVDQKTARIVGPEERLFLDISALVILNSATSPGTSLLAIWNLRVLASMRSNIGNRGNASR